MTGLLLGLLLTALGPTPCHAGDTPAGPEPHRMGADGQPDPLTISFRETDIREVYEMLSRQARVNIVLNSTVSGEISVNLYEVSLDAAIRRIAEAAGFVVEHRDDTYLILPRDEAGRESTRSITEVRSFRIQYVDPVQAKSILEGYTSRYGKITLLEDRHLLVVQDLPEFLNRMEDMLRTIDRQPEQILIEARILEISLTDDELYGIDWSAPFGPLSRGSSLGTNGLAPGGNGLFFNFLSPDLNLTLNALSEKGRVRTLSTPKLMILEDQEAEVVIGDRVGFKVTTIVDQVVTESIEFLESGVILRVKGAVDQQRRIMLEIHPEVSTASVTNNIPSLKTTEVSTQLIANDGEQVFIGGLIKNETAETRSGVPVLGDVPVLGGLFSRTNHRSLNTETVVIITPRLVNGYPGSTSETQSRRVRDTERKLHLRADSVLRKLEAREPRLVEPVTSPVEEEPAMPAAEPAFSWPDEF